jgi:hypothetical protein
MNAIRFLQPSTPASRPAREIIHATGSPSPIGNPYRRCERDFGVGYGNSSGYASAHRYADTRAQPRFRCI